MDDIMTMDEIVDQINEGSINDYDGWGYYCNKDGEETEVFKPSHIDPDKADYVTWYNK